MDFTLSAFKRSALAALSLLAAGMGDAFRPDATIRESARRILGYVHPHGRGHRGSKPRKLSPHERFTLRKRQRQARAAGRRRQILARRARQYKNRYRRDFKSARDLACSFWN